MSQGSLSVAIPSMMSSLGTDLDRIQLVPNRAMGLPKRYSSLPSAGSRHRLGTKRLFLFSTGLFLLARSSAGWPGTPTRLLPGRILQGIGGGPIAPLGMSILYRTFPQEKRGLALGLYNFSNAFGPAIAPALGGYLIEVFNWRAIMYLNVPFSLFSAALVLLRMPPTPEQPPRPFDAVGVVSMASFLVLFLLAVSEGRRYGWSAPLIVTLLVLAGSALLSLFLVTELTVPVPFVELRLHTNLPFTMGCLIGFLNTMEFRGTNFLMPVMLQRLFHYTPFRTGLFFLPPALVMGMTSILRPLVRPCPAPLAPGAGRAGPQRGLLPVLCH